MSAQLGLLVQVVPVAGQDDQESLDLITRRLSGELSGLDVDSVRTLESNEIPAGAMGLAELTGWLTVHLTAAARLRAALRSLADWATRNNRTVECTLEGKTIRITGASREQVDRLIDAWVNEVLR